MIATPSSPRLLLLNWPGADWRLLQPLIDSGRMPNLLALIERGVSGKLAAVAPLLPTSLAATLATGVRADRHGIAGFATAAPTGPIATHAADLQVAPLWEQVAAAGCRAVAVSWPVSHPASGFDALVISDAYACAEGPSFDDWPLPISSLSPAAAGASQVLCDLRLHPTEISAEQVLPFIPQAALIDQETDERLPLLVAQLARATSTHGAGTWLAEEGDWQLLALHFDLLERLSSTFLRYASPRQAQVSELDFKLYRHVVDGAYQFMDLLLGRYLELLDEQTHVMIVSGHGFLSGQRRHAGLAAGTATALQGYDSIGLFACSGPGIKQDELLFGATVLDIVPTVLQLLGLPINTELQGKVQTDIFAAPAVVQEQTQSLAVRHDLPRRPDDWQEWSPQRLLEWQALGYMVDLADAPELGNEQVQIDRLGQLAAMHYGQREFTQALALHQQLLVLAPEHVQAQLGVAECWHALQDARRCREALEELLAGGLRGPNVDFLLGQLSLLEGDTSAAREHLARAEAASADSYQLQEKIARCHLQSEDWEAAVQSFEKSLELHPDYAAAHAGLGKALFKLKQLERASEHYMRSLGLLYQQPDTHYNLGVALAAAGHSQQACNALRNALAIEPDLPHAQAALKKIEQAMLVRKVRELTGDTSA